MKEVSILFTDNTYFTDEETEGQRRAGTCPRPTASEGWRETRVPAQPRLHFPLTRVSFLLKLAVRREQDRNDDEGLEAWQAEATWKGSHQGASGSL